MDSRLLTVLFLLLATPPIGAQQVLIDRFESSPPYNVNQPPTDASLLLVDEGALFVESRGGEIVRIDNATRRAEILDFGPIDGPLYHDREERRLYGASAYVDLDTQTVVSYDRLVNAAKAMTRGPGGSFYLTVENAIWRVDFDTREVENVAGVADVEGFTGDGHGLADARFNNPTDLAWDGGDRLFVADSGNARVRVLDLAEDAVSTLGGQRLGDTVSSIAYADGVVFAAVEEDVIDRRLLRLEVDTGEVTELEQAGRESLDAGFSRLVAAPDGLLYGQLPNTVVAIDPDPAGSVEVRVGNRLESECAVSPDGLDVDFVEAALDPSGRLYLSDTTRLWTLDETHGRLLPLLDNAPTELRLITSIVGTDDGRLLVEELFGLSEATPNRRLQRVAPIPDFGTFLPNFRSDLVFHEGTIYGLNTTGVVSLELGSSSWELLLPYDLGCSPFERGDGGIAGLATQCILGDIAVSEAGDLYFPGLRGVRKLDLQTFIVDTIALTPDAGRIQHLDALPGNRLLGATSVDLGSLAGASMFTLDLESAEYGAVQELDGNLAFLMANRREERYVSDFRSVRKDSPFAPNTFVPLGFDPDSAFGTTVARGGALFVIAGGGDSAVAIYRDDGCRSGIEGELRVSDEFEGSGFGQALATDGSRVFIGAPRANAVAIATTGATHDPWRVTARIDAPAATATFGEQLAIDGDVLAIGDPGGAAVHLHRAATGERLRTVSGAAGFGGKLALGGRRLAVLNAGRVTVHDVDTGSLVAEVEASDATAVAIGGARLAVGVPAADGGRGKVLVFGHDAAEPVLLGERFGGEAGDGFGSALAIDDDYLYVGAPATGTTAAIDLLSADLAPVRSIDSELPAESLGAAVAAGHGRAVLGAPLAQEGLGDAWLTREILDTSAMTGLWFDAATPGDGFYLLGVDGDLVLYYYGSTADGERLWLVSDRLAAPTRFGSSLAFPLFEALGGTFDEPRPSADSLRPWGVVYLDFADTATGRFRLEGREGTRTFTASRLAGRDRDASPLTGIWFDPALEGEGFTILDGRFGTIVYYFGFDGAGQRLWLVSDVLPAGASSGSVTLFRAGAGTFSSPLPAETALEPWGTLTLEAAPDEALRVQLDGDDGRKTALITRLAGLDQ
ncbi:MAG: hypothetical protein AAGE01_23215 [Pseudomonadota bacterium]